MEEMSNERRRKRASAFLKSHPVSSATLGAGVVGALAIGTVSPTLGGIAIGAALFSAAASAVAENTLLNNRHKDDLWRG